jgi:hypothetical protein
MPQFLTKGTSKIVCRHFAGEEGMELALEREIRIRVEAGGLAAACGVIAFRQSILVAVRGWWSL